tara:strand:+ start:1580 stop:1693 length:114 start_codon:yes stop_codon:yes gene_type:complete
MKKLILLLLFIPLGFDWENDNKPNEYPTWDSILEKLL